MRVQIVEENVREEQQEFSDDSLDAQDFEEEYGPTDANRSSNVSSASRQLI